MFDTHRNRSGIDRRNGNDRRKKVSPTSYKILNQRSDGERRSEDERRNEWVKVSKWSSAYLGIPIYELVLH